MEFKLYAIFTFLFVAVVASHAARPTAVYWNSMFPQTAMPKFIEDLLHEEWLGDKSTSVDVRKGGINVNTGKGTPDTGHNIVAFWGHPANEDVNPLIHWKWGHPADEDQLQHSPYVALFFFEKDLYPGSSMNMHFFKSGTPSTLVPPKVSESFFHRSIPKIYEKFSVKPNSREAETTTANTVPDCVVSAVKGEENYCATSLKSMIDFSISKLGQNIQGISTEIEKETQLQKYTIVGVKKRTSKAGIVGCHKLKYAYTVFYCHKIESSEAYDVSMVGADGTKVKAPAVCHKDTSAWNPKHLAFQVLKVKPGSVPVCHFLPQDNIVWATNT